MQKGTPKGAYPGLTRRPENGLYQFKLDLPKDVREAFGRRFVVVSLGTEDRRIAVEKWAPLHAEWRDKIRQARSGTLRNINDRAAWDIAAWLIDYTEPYSESPSRYLHPVEPLTLSGIAGMVRDDLDQIDEVTDDDGFVYRLAELTEGDRLAVIAAVQDQLFRRLSGQVEAGQTRIRAIAEQARSIKPVEAKVEVGAPHLMDAYDSWKASGNSRVKTHTEFKASCEEFIQINGDLPLTEITEEHFLAYKKHLYAVKSKRTGQPLAQMTRNKRMGGVKAVIQNAVDDRIIKVHPGANVSVEKGSKSKLRIDGLFDDEIKLLFDSPIFTEGFRPKEVGEAAYWVPVLAFFTGARQSELCQLMVADVVKRDGIVCLRITDDESEGQHVKTEGSVRLVPLADKVIELGFMKYVATLNQKGKLFPDVRADSHGVAGGLFSKWYGKYRKEIGLIRKGADFHAIRHLAKTALRGTAGDSEAKFEITGHSSGTVSAGYGRIAVKEMKKIVDQIAYDVRIPKWKPAT